MTIDAGFNVDTTAIAVLALSTATVLVMILFGLGCGMCGVQVCKQRKKEKVRITLDGDGSSRVRVIHAPNVPSALRSNLLSTGFPVSTVEVLDNNPGTSTTAEEYDFKGGGFKEESNDYCLPELINPATDHQDSGVYSYARIGSELVNKPCCYLIPAGQRATLYSQIVDFKIEELPRHTILIGETMGAGNFGKVCRGEMVTFEDISIKVAVKTLKEGAEEKERVKFLQEAAIMGQFKHPNVVKVHGIVTTGDPVLIVLELLANGDLEKYLARKRFSRVTSPIDQHTLLSYCRQVASGMVYLSNKSFVHRDLAARNILLSEHGMCKIADFGLSRDLMDEEYYISRGGMIPVKWTAPEALHYKKYSTASDVWSYGIMLYEIWTLGRKPYEGFGLIELVRKIDGGYRLPPPPGCPRAIYEIMINVWHPQKEERPNFTAVLKTLSAANNEVLYRAKNDWLATELGSELTNALSDIFKDLQYRYKSSINLV